MLKVPICCGLALVLLAPRPTDPWIQRSTYLMGTELDISVAGDRARGVDAIEAAFGAVRHLEAVLSDWQPGSDLSALNRSDPGAPTRPGSELWSLLAEALEWTRRTGGAFDPGIGALNDAWDMRGPGRVPGDSALAAARDHTGLLRFSVDSTSHTWQRPDSASWIDAGGFGKGAGLAVAAAALRAHDVRAGMLNFGGQVLVFGDTLIRVAVARPDARSSPFVQLLVRDVSLSTSGQSERYIEVAGKRYGHILDPRTGMPVPSWGSVTVIHPDPLVADILSTALYVMGPAEGMRWLHNRKIAALFLVLDGDAIRLVSTPLFAQYLDPESQRIGE